MSYILPQDFDDKEDINDVLGDMGVSIQEDAINSSGD